MPPPPQEDSSPNAPSDAALIGNLVDLKAGEILLPDSVARNADGVFVDPAAMGGGDAFARFADRVFTGGAYFRGLDYPVFLDLLRGIARTVPGKPAVRLAADLLSFAPQRRALYKAVKIAADGESAEYLFEPVSLEIEEASAEETVARSEPTRLTFDEFVAHLWLSGVRFGIDEKTVRRAIETGDTERVEVAHECAPTAGVDARLEEVSKALHRDDSPKMLPNGQIDLSQFGNRYPQVQEGEVLLRKLPRKPGEPGRRLSGEIIEPEMPADFALGQMAGAGTRIEQRDDGEYIVAAMTGFLDIDPKSNQVAVTEKIISREGVSMRTTGNLSLAGEDYEEYGEVQERRVVEGKNMTFHANVYGSLLSRGGMIRVEATLSGGRASSPGGEVVIAQRASASVVEALRGKVHIKYAEGCTISAGEVVVEHAVMCQIVAESVEIGTAEGCAVAARSVNIAVCTARKDTESVISMLVPDLAAQAEDARRIAGELADKRAELERSRERLTAMQRHEEFAKFLSLQARIKKGEIRLAPAQAASLQKAAAQFAPAIQELRTLSARMHVLSEAVAALTHEAQALEQAQATQGEGIRCLIESVTGDTIVRTRHHDGSQGLFGEGQLSTLINQLRGFGEAHERLFSGCSGRFGWQYGAEPGPAEEEGWVR